MHANGQLSIAKVNGRDNEQIFMSCGVPMTMLIQRERMGIIWNTAQGIGIQWIEYQILRIQFLLSTMNRFWLLRKWVFG